MSVFPAANMYRVCESLVRFLHAWLMLTQLLVHHPVLAFLYHDISDNVCSYTHTKREGNLKTNHFPLYSLILNSRVHVLTRVMGSALLCPFNSPLILMLKYLHFLFLHMSVPWIQPSMIQQRKQLKENSISINYQHFIRRLSQNKMTTVSVIVTLRLKPPSLASNF